MKKTYLTVIGVLILVIIICLIFIFILLSNVEKLTKEISSDGTSKSPTPNTVTSAEEYTNYPEDNPGNNPSPGAPVTSAAVVTVSPQSLPKMLKTGTPTYVNEYNTNNVLKSKISIQKFDVVFKAVTDQLTGATFINADITVNGYCNERYDESPEKTTRGIIYNVIGPDGKQVYQGVLVTPEIGVGDRFNVTGEIPFSFEPNKTYKIEFEKDIMI
ncbi:MAG: hypothetical protein LBL93_07070 [Ruminococcus sp.]|jgi:hypothetical protein|nr:hypothetical protein [Ruminococcus sp.]